MKENVEALKDKVVDAAQAAGRVAKLAATISQKKVLIAREQERIRRNYTRLGKVYYKDYVTDEEPDEAEYKPLCEEISNSFRYINDLKEDIEDAKEAYRAAKQQAKQDADVEILPYLPESAAEEKPEEKPEEKQEEKPDEEPKAE
jgi:hypothetical protein